MQKAGTKIFLMLQLNEKVIIMSVLRHNVLCLTQQFR